jgi:hypothetical protein
MKTPHIPGWLYFLFAGVMAVALIFHWQHVLTYAPFIFILACPLMHLFHGHGGHGQTNSEKKDAHHSH